MNKMVTCPVVPSVMTCRPPLAVESSENANVPCDVLWLVSTCTEPAERRVASAPLSRAGAVFGTGVADALAAGAAVPEAVAEAAPEAVPDAAAELLPAPLQPASAPAPSSAA